MRGMHSRAIALRRKIGFGLSHQNSVMSHDASGMSAYRAQNSSRVEKARALTH